jgi:hypothetical protein
MYLNIKSSYLPIKLSSKSMGLVIFRSAHQSVFEGDFATMKKYLFLLALGALYSSCMLSFDDGPDFDVIFGYYYKDGYFEVSNDEILIVEDTSMMPFGKRTNSGLAYTLRLIHSNHKKYAAKDSISVLLYYFAEDGSKYVDSNNINGYLIPLRQISSDSGKVIFQSRYLAGDTLTGKIIYFIRKPEQVYETDVYRLIPAPDLPGKVSRIIELL